MTVRGATATLLVGVSVVLALASSPSTPALASAYPPRHGPTGSVTVSNVTVFAGDPAEFRGCGFTPGGTVHPSLNEVPNRDVVSDSRGCFALSYVFRSVGSDILIAVGTGRGGGSRTVKFFVTVDPRASTSGGLPFTGFDAAAAITAGVCLLGGGLLFMALGRRRRPGRIR
jgi:hypothetical protein